MGHSCATLLYVTLVGHSPISASVTVPWAQRWQRQWSNRFAYYDSTPNVCCDLLGPCTLLPPWWGPTPGWEVKSDAAEEEASLFTLRPRFAGRDHLPDQRTERFFLARLLLPALVDQSVGLLLADATAASETEKNVPCHCPTSP